jgi:YegS/Rv2252/BmrU family lipid kinase
LKTRFIINPRSGRAVRALSQVRAFAEAHDAEITPTERSRHATELATAAVAEGCECVVAVGGDGTMNEVASALIGSTTILGLIPCGSGDGLGRHLGIHGSVAHALNILVSGEPRLIDTGYVNGRPFFTAAGIGFEAHIAERFNQLRRRGFLRYLTTSLRALRRWKPETYTITQAEERTVVRAFTLAVTNSDQYGNNALITPGARADDGLLDLCAIPPLNCFNALPLLIRLFAGSIDRQPRIYLRRGTRFIVERPAAGPFHTDGEIYQGEARLEFTIRPASLRIMTPRGRSSDLRTAT